MAESSINSLGDLVIIDTCVNKIGQKVLKCIFDTMYSHADSKSDGGNKTLQQWLSDNGVSKKHIKNKLRSSLLWIEKTPRDLNDINSKYYFVLILKLNKDMYDKHFDGGYTERLQEMKKYSDQARHVGSFKDVNEFIKYFKKLCRGLITEVEDILGIDTYTYGMKKNLDKMFNQVCKNSNFTPSDKNLIEKAVKELLEQKPKITIDPDSLDIWTTILDVNFFAKPFLTYNGEELKIENLFENLNNPVEDSVQNFLPIIIHGAAGSGKTKICDRIFMEWCKLKQSKKEELTDQHSFFQKNHMNKFDLVFVIKLRDHGSDDLNSVILNSIIPKSSSECNINEGNLNNIYSKFSILFLLDGFDEMKKKDIKSKFLADIIKLSSKNKKVRIILTTRGDYLQRAEKIFLSDVNKIHLHGLPRCSDFVEKLLCLLKSEESYILQFNEFLKSRENMLKDQLNLPLTIALLVVLWFDSKLNVESLKEINTATKLFDAITNLLKHRIEGKICVEKDYLDVVLNKISCCTFEQLGYPNFSLEINKKHYSDIKKCFLNDLHESESESELRCKKTLSGFTIHTLDTTKKNKDNNYTYRYFHKTQMEHLSARHICNNTDKLEENLKVLTDHSDTMRFEDILPFIAGILADKKELDFQSDTLLELEFMKRKIDNADAECAFLWRLIGETWDDVTHPLYKPSSCRKMKFCKSLGEKLPRYWKFSETNIEAGLNIVSHCYIPHLKQIEIDFSLNTAVEKDCRLKGIFIEVLERLKRSSIESYGRKSKIEVNLYFKCHTISPNELSDHYLPYFEAWSSLIHFTGCIEKKKGRDLLKLHKNLKILELQIKTYSMFNDLISECIPHLSRLKKVTLHFHNINDVTKFKKIKMRSGTEINIIFHNVQENQLLSTLQLVNHIHGGEYSTMKSVLYNRSDLPSSVKIILQIFNSLKNLGLEKVSVYSSQHCENDNIVREELKGTPFLIEWNGNKLN